MTISVLYQPSVFGSEIEAVYEALKPYDSDVSATAGRAPGPQNALEWALPVAIALICSAPVTSFIDGFFGSAGEDAYEKLKGAISRAFKRAKENGLSWTSRNSQARRSPPLGVQINLEGGHLRFVFPDNLEVNEVATALSEMDRNIAFLTKVIVWQKRQFELRDSVTEELYGPGYPVHDNVIFRRDLMSQIAFGTWVYSVAAGSWVKAA